MLEERSSSQMRSKSIHVHFQHRHRMPRSSRSITLLPRACAMRTTKQLKGLLTIASCSALFGACAIDSYDENVDEESQEAGVFPSVASFAARGPFATTQVVQG